MKKENDTLETLVRDICSVDYIKVKSEIRARLLEWRNEERELWKKEFLEDILKSEAKGFESETIIQSLKAILSHK